MGLDLVQAAKGIHTVIKTGIARTDASVFLVGKSVDCRDSYRETLRRALLRKQPWGFRLQVHYPEDLFEDLLSLDGRRNLLGLENQLAASVHAVVIMLEDDSPGAFCELGAFANHPGLSNKLIVVAYQEYRKAKSFIRRGPLAYLEHHTKSEVVWWNREEMDIATLVKKKVLPDVRRRWYDQVRGAADAMFTTSLNNFVFAQVFALFALFVAEPASYEQLEHMMCNVSDGPADDPRASVRASLGGLQRRGHAFRSADGEGFCLTAKGLRRANWLLHNAEAPSRTADVLDCLRVDRLNTLRRTRQGG